MVEKHDKILRNVLDIVQHLIFQKKSYITEMILILWILMKYFAINIYNSNVPSTKITMGIEKSPLVLSIP